jgi:hypothetical protein
VSFPRIGLKHKDATLSSEVTLYPSFFFIIVLEEADLRECALRGSDIRKAQLSRADLRGAKLTAADLRGASLASADLRDLEDPDQPTETADVSIAGADLSDARLPATFGLEDVLGKFQELAAATLNIFLFFAAGLAYSLLMAITNTDDKLLPNYATLALPFLQTTVPISAFFIFTPLILLLPFSYLHFHLLRFFRVAARLPSILPDGSQGYDCARPWILTVLLRRLVQKSTDYADTRWVGARLLGEPITVFFIWFGAPVAIFVFWALSRNSTEGPFYAAFLTC